MPPMAELALQQNTLPINPEISIPHDISNTFKEESTDWKHANLLKKNYIRAAKGIVSSEFLVSLNPFETQIQKITNDTSDLEKKAKNFNVNYKEHAILKEAQTKTKGLKNFLQTVCSSISYTTKRVNKRFVSLIVFSILISIAAYGISEAVASSSRLLTREDIKTANDTSAERFLLNKLELKRLNKDSKRIDSLEERIDKAEFNDAFDEVARKLVQLAENEIKELQLMINPESYKFENSFFMERMALDIRSYFAANQNDLFDHVYGTGITEVMYFTTFQTIVLRDGNSNDCEDGSLRIVAKTIIPNTDIVGTATEDPQRYETQDGRNLYIGKDFIPEGSAFRPERSLSSQRLILTSKEISLTVLNNTVFMIQNKGLHLDINITCPGKNATQKTLYNNPFLRLHTECEVSSVHLNISSYTQEYQKDKVFDDLNLFDNIDEELNYVIGYHRTALDNKHDISEMFEKAHDIFIKETEILQHEMEKLEGESSIIKELEKAGTAVSEWFNQSLHTIVGTILGIALCIVCILFLVGLIKCCSFYAKKTN